MTFEEKSAREFWKEILNHKGYLSDEEAEEMHRLVKKLRKERGFRV